MTPDSPASAAGTRPQPQVVEEIQHAGYRIFDVRATAGPRDKSAKPRSRFLRITDRAYQVVDYGFMLLYGLLAVRFLLGVAAANEQAGFVRFIKFITTPFYAPFTDIVPSPAVGKGVFDMPLLICLLAFLLVHLALRGLLHVLLGTRGRSAS
jgi:hypothetical protein